jgi:hypothetical protein
MIGLALSQHDFSQVNGGSARKHGRQSGALSNAKASLKAPCERGGWWCDPVRIKRDRSESSAFEHRRARSNTRASLKAPRANAVVGGATRCGSGAIEHRRSESSVFEHRRARSNTRASLKAPRANAVVGRAIRCGSGAIEHDRSKSSAFEHRRARSSAVDCRTTSATPRWLAGLGQERRRVERGRTSSIKIERFRTPSSAVEHSCESQSPACERGGWWCDPVRIRRDRT